MLQSACLQWDLVAECFVNNLMGPDVSLRRSLLFLWVETNSVHSFALTAGLSSIRRELSGIESSDLWHNANALHTKILPCYRRRTGTASNSQRYTLCDSDSSDLTVSTIKKSVTKGETISQYTKPLKPPVTTYVYVFVCKLYFESNIDMTFCLEVWHSICF